MDRINASNNYIIVMISQGKEDVHGLFPKFNFLVSRGPIYL